MLQFDGTPLPQAVRLANRYSERQIVLLGDLRGLRVTGAFRAGDTIGLSKALAAAFDLSLRQTPNGDLVLSAGGPSDPRKKKGG
jgi:ferric-dicitrate binding protein FerR (iron transport regulator)